MARYQTGRHFFNALKALEKRLPKQKRAEIKRLRAQINNLIRGAQLKIAAAEL